MDNEQISNEEIGDRLKSLMDSKNISVKKLADKIGISKKSLDNYRNGHTGVPIVILKPLAKELDCDVDCLLCLQDMKTRSHQDLSDLTGITSEDACNELLLRKRGYNKALEWMLDNGIDDIFDSLDISINKQAAVEKQFRMLPLHIRKLVNEVTDEKNRPKSYTMDDSGFLVYSSDRISEWVYNLTESLVANYLDEIKDIEVNSRSYDYVPYVSVLLDNVSRELSRPLTKRESDHWFDEYQASKRYKNDEALFNFCSSFSQAYYNCKQQAKIDLYFSTNSFTNMAHDYVAAQIEDQLKVKKGDDGND